LAGLPGAGKTTLARALQGRLALSLVSRDDIRAAMFQPCTFTSEEKEAAFRALLSAVETHLRAGRSCIVDGVAFSRVEDRERLASVVLGSGGIIDFVLLVLPVEIAQQRVEADRPTNLIADRTAQLVAEVARRFSPFQGAVLKVDAQLSPTALAERVTGLLAP